MEYRSSYYETLRKTFKLHVPPPSFTSKIRPLIFDSPMFIGTSLTPNFSEPYKVLRGVSACPHERELFTIKTRNQIIDYLHYCLKGHADEFDAFVISGYSMAMVAPILAHMMGKNVVLVRKPTERRHSTYGTEGEHRQRCVFVDDLISSGETVARVMKDVQQIDCYIVGYLCYNTTRRSELIDTAYPNIKYMGVENV